MQEALQSLIRHEDLGQSLGSVWSHLDKLDIIQVFHKCVQTPDSAIHCWGILALIDDPDQLPQ